MTCDYKRRPEIAWAAGAVLAAGSPPQDSPYGVWTRAVTLRR